MKSPIEPRKRQAPHKNARRRRWESKAASAQFGLPDGLRSFPLAKSNANQGCEKAGHGRLNRNVSQRRCGHKKDVRQKVRHIEFERLRGSMNDRAAIGLGRLVGVLVHTLILAIGA